jgi:hypothetical protein
MVPNDGISYQARGVLEGNGPVFALAHVVFWNADFEQLLCTHNISVIFLEIPSSNE